MVIVAKGFAAAGPFNCHFKLVNKCRGNVKPQSRLVPPQEEVRAAVRLAAMLAYFLERWRAFLRISARTWSNRLGHLNEGADFGSYPFR